MAEKIHQKKMKYKLKPFSGLNGVQTGLDLLARCDVSGVYARVESQNCL